MNVKQEFYENYCFALTITHNYLVSEHLLNNYSNSWSIVSGYYSLMTIGRLLCNIGSKDYPKEHGSFFKFLNGRQSSLNGQKTSMNINRDVLLQNLERYDEDIEHVFRKLGYVLSKLVKIRTHSNYEQFVISHQFYHRDITPSLISFIPKLKDATLEWLWFALEFFLKYVDSLPIAGECFGLILDQHKESVNTMIDEGVFMWGFKQFLEEHHVYGADKKKIRNVENLWERAVLPYSSKVIPVKDSFYEDITIDKHAGKQDKIKSFIDSLKEFRQ